jgi:Tfp pilus assembly protein PilF
MMSRLTTLSLATQFDFLVYSVNSGRSGGSSTDECARRLYRKLSSLVHSDSEHQALLAAAKRNELRTTLLPVRLVDIIELRLLHVRRKQRNEDLLLELDEATQVYFRAVRALKEPGAPATVERLLEKCLAHNAQHVAALTMLANLLQQDEARTEEAEKKFRLLLRANPVRADSLQNFALFVELKMKDHDTAEVLYTRALTIEPSNPRVLANFAVFLKNVRHDYDFADSLYKRAIQAAPTSANTIGNYALFLYSVRNDNLKADQLFRLAISLEERAATGADVPAALESSVAPGAAASAAFWKRRYEAFLEALQRSGQLQALLNSQLPPLAIPRTADVERLERLNRKRTEEQKQRDAERAIVERAARRKAQRLPAAVVRCVRALVSGWHGVSPTDACVCLQRDDMHVPQLEADDAASDDAHADGAAVACTCSGGKSGDIVSSVLFRRARDACVEGTYERVLHAIQVDEAAAVLDNAAEDEIDRQAVADTSGASGARGARECMIRALNMLRGRESRLTRRCYHAMAALVSAALNAAFAVDAFAQCRDLMHMANTYRLDDLGVAEELQRGAISNGVQHDDDGSSLESLTTSLESSEEDGGIRAPSAASGATTAMVAAQPPIDANGSHAVKREAALRASRLTTMSRSLTLLRLLRSSSAMVWRSRVFWESALTDELRTQQLRQSGGGASVVNDKSDVFDSSEALNEGDARTTALVLGQVASFATMMVHLDCDFDFIADFVDKQCVVFNLPTATRDDLLQHAATASLVETMRDVSFSRGTD